MVQKRVNVLIKRIITVKIETGLQARPAAEFVQEANRFTAEIFLEKDGNQVNAKSIMGLMSLAIISGESITLSVEGIDAELALDHLEAFVTTINKATS